eukprot:9669122-Ditylum_brightwellii.AAC.1
MTEFTEMITSDNGVKQKPIAGRNLKAKSIIEIIHRTIGNMIRSFEMYNTNIGEKYLWPEVIRTVRFTTRTIVHTPM